MKFTTQDLLKTLDLTIGDQAQVGDQIITIINYKRVGYNDEEIGFRVGDSSFPYPLRDLIGKEFTKVKTYSKCGDYENCENCPFFRGRYEKLCDIMGEDPDRTFESTINEWINLLKDLKKDINIPEEE